MVYLPRHVSHVTAPTPGRFYPERIHGVIPVSPSGHGGGGGCPIPRTRVVSVSSGYWHHWGPFGQYTTWVDTSHWESHGPMGSAPTPTVASTNQSPSLATLIVWSLLGACGMGVGWMRRSAWPPSPIPNCQTTKPASVPCGFLMRRRQPCTAAFVPRR